MSIDLDLIFFKHYQPMTPQMLGFTVLRLEQDYDLFRQIEPEFFESKEKPAVRPLPLPPRTSILMYNEEKGTELRTKDHYGRRFTYVLAPDLVKFVKPSKPPKGQRSDWNNAIWAFLAALPEESFVVLDWC